MSAVPAVPATRLETGRASTCRSRSKGTTVAVVVFAFVAWDIIRKCVTRAPAAAPVSAPRPDDGLLGTSVHAP